MALLAALVALVALLVSLVAAAEALEAALPACVEAVDALPEADAALLDELVSLVLVFIRKVVCFSVWLVIYGAQVSLTLGKADLKGVNSCYCFFMRA